MTVQELMVRLKHYYNESNEEKIAIITVWVNEQNLTEKELDKLYTDILESECYFPMIAVLKKYIQHNDVSKAYEAYGIAMKAIRERSAKETAKKYPIIHQTIKNSWGDWSAFGLDSQPSNIRQKQFMDCYLSLMGSGLQIKQRKGVK